ncbi:MAG: Tfx family DNA-binding protein [Thaumarchaeota archaeon]|jgi:Tfx family DNA-binding protein|nr:Tfx family DNA-binding protein [Nitrososphaerota archaeon]
MAAKKVGLLTERQIEVLKLRAQGLTQEEVAKRLNTTRENVSILEKRAYQNIKLARETLAALKSFGVAVSVVIKPGTHLVDVPRIILNKADEANIKVKANFTRIYDEIRFRAGDKVKRTRVIRPITVKILPNGDFTVE